MKSFSCLAAAALCLTAVASRADAQNFVYYPDNNVAPNYAAPGGWFPWFTNATGTRIQTLVPGSVFQGVTGGGLNSIGFFLGGSTPANTTATFTMMQVRIAPSPVAALTNTFATNMPPGTEILVVDLPGSSYAANQNTWVDLSFLANYPIPAGPIIVDIQTQIPTGGAYLASSVSSLVPRCVQGTYTGQATGTLSTGNGPKMRFGYQPDNILVVNTTGAGTGDLFASLTLITPGAGEGYLFISATTFGAPGAGPMLGIVPDATTWSILAQPLTPGSPLHFPIGFPGVFPDQPFVLPPTTLSFLAGQTWDFVAMVLDPLGPTYLGRSNVVRVNW
jgi:hypothetical protein